MSRAALFHAPSHGTREILLIFGALHTADPGDIHRTIDSLVADKIRARVIGLAAQVAICRELVSKTNNGDTSGYGVVMHEQHFRELMMEVTTPPITDDETKTASSDSGTTPFALRLSLKTFTRRLSLFALRNQSLLAPFRMPCLRTHPHLVYASSTLLSPSLPAGQLGRCPMERLLPQLAVFLMLETVS
jgi:hypothetical protein